MNFRELPDLASERLGGSVLDATDDFFAEKENLIKTSEPLWRESEYTDRGKWMDGWESRRKRTPGHDHATIRLGAPGIIRGLVVDTSYFRGNYPEHCSLEASTNGSDWIEVLARSPLHGDSENLFAVDSPFAFTHVRLHIYPDGGVARLRVHGQVVPDWHAEGGLDREQDLAAIEHGGQVLACSDMFFGPKHNLIMPGRAFDMSDGWETRRRRGPGNDWVIVKLACEADVRRIEVDTNHFKGNYPDTCSIDVSPDGESWSELLPRTKLQADTRHLFRDELTPGGPATHVRLNVYPDGGVARMRVHAIATERGREAMVTQRINTSVGDGTLRAICGSSEWVRRMMEARPLANALDASDEIWSSLSEHDWREAFAAHPRIGERSPEQNLTAIDATKQALIETNRAYEEKFGHIYIVCATGKSQDEMLAIARQRIGNTPEEELRNAAEEQRKIMRLRLMRLVT